MTYGKYFKKGQKIFLKRIFTDQDQRALDTVTAYTVRSYPTQLDVTLPYGSDAADSYPFEPDMRFEIMTDHKGMGLRLMAKFAGKISRQDIRLVFEGNLEFISQRIYPRVDVNAWLGLKRSRSDLAAMRKLCLEHLQKIKSGVSAAELTHFKKYPINLAAGGLRLPLDPPVEPAELVLVYLSIGDKQGIVCTLAEVVWVGSEGPDGRVPAGLRFLNILEKDQSRIDAVVKNLRDLLNLSNAE
ncbi:MAG: PilZ domain-containing protein [Desulfuromonadales bacterium]|jgi:hypothetical protein